MLSVDFNKNQANQHGYVLLLQNSQLSMLGYWKTQNLK